MDLEVILFRQYLERDWLDATSHVSSVRQRG